MCLSLCTFFILFFLQASFSFGVQWMDTKCKKDIVAQLQFREIMKLVKLIVYVTDI